MEELVYTGYPKGEEIVCGGGVAHRREFFSGNRPKSLEKRGSLIGFSDYSPQVSVQESPCPLSRYLRSIGRFLEIKSSLFSGDTPWRVWGSSEISLSRISSTLSNRPRREGLCTPGCCTCFPIFSPVSGLDKGTTFREYYQILQF